MALNFNPFEKDKAAPTPKTKSTHTHHRVFDDPTKQSPERELTAPPITTEAKSSSNQGQTEAKLETEPRPNQGQTEAKPNTSGATKRANRGRTEAKLETELRPISRPYRGHTEAKLETELRPNVPVYSIDGLQRQILFLIFDHCKKARDKQTPPIAVQHITENCKTTYHAARKAIQRLEQKGLLKRGEFKVGRSGWTKYEIPNASYQELLQSETEAKLRPIRGQTEVELETELRPEPRPTPSSSSSYKDLDLRTTNTAVEPAADLPEAWRVIDFSPLASTRFGFQQLVQLSRLGTLTPDQAQESIHAFAFDLEANGKSREINGAALNYFMGILRKGPYAPPANYESPELRQMRLYLEAKERELKQREALESKLEAIEFEGWVTTLSVAEKSSLVSPTDFARIGSPGHNVQLKQFFRENVWPELKKSIAQSGLNSQEQK